MQQEMQNFEADWKVKITMKTGEFGSAAGSPPPYVRTSN